MRVKSGWVLLGASTRKHSDLGSDYPPHKNVTGHTHNNVTEHSKIMSLDTPTTMSLSILTQKKISLTDSA